jgi:hypothetical protein
MPTNAPSVLQDALGGQTRLPLWRKTRERASGRLLALSNGG